MPRRLTPEQHEGLQAGGVIGSPETLAVEPGAVLRALGDAGLPGMERVEQMGDPEQVGSTYAHEDLPYGITELGSEAFKQKLVAAHGAAQVLSLVGEAAPSLSHPDIIEQSREAVQAFMLYEQNGLVPEIVMTPVNRSLDFWKTVYGAAQESALNYPAINGQKVLRNGGLTVADVVKASWIELTERPQPNSGFAVEVVSGTNQANITSVTHRGFADVKEKTRHPELDVLMSKLNSLWRVAVTKVVPSSANLHPQADTYIMFQLARILNGQNPVDPGKYCWIKRKLPDLDDSAVVGTWEVIDGRVSLGWNPDDVVSNNLGIRPTGRGLDA